MGLASLETVQLLQDSTRLVISMGSPSLRLFNCQLCGFPHARARRNKARSTACERNEFAIPEHKQTGDLVFTRAGRHHILRPS